MYGDAEAAMHGKRELRDIESANARLYVSHDGDTLTWLGRALVLLEHLDDADITSVDDVNVWCFWISCDSALSVAHVCVFFPASWIPTRRAAHTLGCPRCAPLRVLVCTLRLFSAAGAILALLTD